MAASRLALRGKAAVPAAVRLCRQADALAAAGRAEEADAAYRHALATDPALAGAHNNHGNVLRALGRIEAAAAAYRAALRCGLDVGLVRYNLAAVLRQAGRLEEAASAYRHALCLDPDYAEAWNNQANLLRDRERLTEAAIGYRRAVAIRPDWTDGHDNLASALYLLHDRGEHDTAARLARDWRRDHPDNPVARHIGSAIAGDSTEVRAPDAYVRQTFDLFAAEFDDRLAALGYQAPALLIEAVAASGPAPSGQFQVLDAGCGTGLCAAGLRPYARHLSGVDLSGGMLARAQARGHYDALHEAELVAHLRAHQDRFDLIVAADVLCYFGDLFDAFAAVAGALRAGGRLAFSVERLTDTDDGNTDNGNTDGVAFRVGTHGRYAHQPAYVLNALAASGLRVVHTTEHTLRHESGEPVVGLVIVAVTPG